MMDSVVAWLLDVVGQMGYLGVFLLMFLESTFFPFPSEVIIIPAAYLAALGEMNIYIVVVMGILGSVCGALFNYYIAVKLGRPLILKSTRRYGNYILINEKTYLKTEEYFRKHGEISTFVGRLIVGVRQLISLPAGLARMNVFKFALFTALGATIWVVILAVIGYTLGANQALVDEYLGRTTFYLIVFSVLLVLGYVWWYKRRKLGQNNK